MNENNLRGVLMGAAVAVAAMIQPGQAANEWGIEFEKKSRVQAKVVDLLCEVTGDCVEACGAGKRQLGLLFDDGPLVPVVKNRDPFAGATVDLIEYCGKRITADGLMIDDPQMPMFAIQFKRETPTSKWKGATQWGKDWSKANGNKKSNQWFKSDPAVLKHIREHGVFGIPGLKPEQ